MPKTALFDLDGTLIDSAPGIFASIAAMLRGLGHVPDPAADYTWMVGPPLEQAVDRLLAPYGDTRTTEALVLYRTHYGAEGMLASTLYPGIVAMLDAFAAGGWVLYVVTSKREVFARAILDMLQMSGRFAAIHGSLPGSAGGAVPEGKPELLRNVLDRYGIDRGGAVMIGDRIHDIEAAAANGVPSLAVRWGYGTAAEWAQATAVVDRPEQVPDAAAALLD